jgi:DnaJ-class molecular chaperone
MTDYYQTLGVSDSATPDEIKKAYRSLANKHHPDKGGDQAKFKDISVAYDILSNAQKKADYDNQRRFGGGPEMRFHTGNMNEFNDIFGQAFGGFDPFAHNSNPFFGRRNVARNRDLNITCQISLLDSFLGKQLEANYQLPSGRPQTVVINIPPGIQNGETIRYGGLGDDSVPHIQRGNLNVTIVVMSDPTYTRNGDDLYTTINISPIDAMIGCRKKVKLITGQEMDLDIRPGVDPGTEFASHGQGFSNPHTNNKGRFVTIVNIRTPSITNPNLISRLQQINNEINNQS